MLIKIIQWLVRFQNWFLEASTWFTCTVSSIVNGGNICNLKGVATFNSPSDTFSNIAIST